jgi:hypothetical protein
MTVQFSLADKIIFTVIAVLAAAVAALIVFGCDGQAVDADAGTDGGVDAETDATDSGPDTDTSDSGPDSGGLARCPKPNDCLTEVECLELGQTVLPEFFCAAAGEVCCHVTM